MKKIIIDGTNLCIKEVINVAVHDYFVVIEPNAIQKIKNSQTYISQQVQERKIIYGVTTGFGPNADKRIPIKDAELLQHKLLISHSCGVGNGFSREMVRAIMLIRMNTLLAGHSGIRIQTIKLLLQFLNHHIHPFVPEQGSVGASGDLAPLSHVASSLIGFGKVEFNNTSYSLSELYELPAIQKINQEITNFNNENKYNPLDDDYQMPIVKWRLTHKESIALINGTTVMNALGVIGIYRAKRLLNTSIRSGAMALEAHGARKQAFDEAVHIVRRHSGQLSVAKALNQHFGASNLMGISSAEIVEKLPPSALDISSFQPIITLIKERIDQLKAANLPQLQLQIAQLSPILNFSEISHFLESNTVHLLMETIPKAFCRFLMRHLKDQDEHDWLSWRQLLFIAMKKVTPQDAYSFRCMPQVLGASRGAIDYLEQVISNELNAVVDNPIIFLEGQTLPDGTVIKESRIVSAGNFHGQPLALALDYLKIAIAEIGSLLERQICKLTDQAHNDGLPAFLVETPGLNSGMMILQYAAAALVSENKVIAHPASVDSIPTSANQEDHVSMGPIAGRQALQMIGNVEKILAMHLINSKQALNMRIKQFEGKIKLNISENSQTLTQLLENLGIVYYENDRYMYDEIDNVKRNLNQFFELN